MMEIIFLILGLVPLCYWVYVHLNYQQIFKKEHPEEFEKNKIKEKELDSCSAEKC